MTHQDASRGHHPVWVPPLPHTKPPSTIRPAGGPRKPSYPRDAGRHARKGTRKHRTLTDAGAAAARHPPQHGESSSMRERTEAVGASTTHRPNRHHLPPIPVAGPRGPPPNGRTTPPFPRRPSERNRQRSSQAPISQQTLLPGRPPPPSRRRWPVRHRGDGTPRTRGRGDPQLTSDPNRGWGDEPPKAFPGKQGWTSPAPDTGTCHPTNPTLAATQPNRRGADDAPQ